MRQIKQEDNQLHSIKLQQKVASVKMFKQISKNSKWKESEKKDYMNNDPNLNQIELEQKTRALDHFVKTTVKGTKKINKVIKPPDNNQIS